jgi:HPt (histidine-containing phosphotransfer) domain-containing protein
VASLTDGLDPELAARFEQLRQHFVAGLPQRLQEFSTAANAQTLEAALHRLAGAAGAYGYADLGILARETMQASSADNAAGRSVGLARLAAEFQRVTSERISTGAVTVSSQLQGERRF